MSATITLIVRRLADDKVFREKVSGEPAMRARMANLNSLYPGKLKIEAFSNWVGAQEQETRIAGDQTVEADDLPDWHRE